MPEPDTPVTQVNSPSGISAVTLRRLLPEAPTIRISFSGSNGTRRCGRGIERLPLKYWPVIEAGLARISRGVPLRDDLAAVHARARAEVDDVVGLENRFLVVLDDDHGVADVAQRFERAEQPPVVALMQSDRGLIQDVHDAGESGADLAGEADALRFAAGERLGAAIERQVVEPHVDQEAQTVGDVLDDLGGDLAAPAAEIQGAEELERLADRQMRGLGQAAIRRRRQSERRDSAACPRNRGTGAGQDTSRAPRAP